MKTAIKTSTVILSRAVLLVFMMGCSTLPGCVQSAFLRGRVTDVSGEELPGVVVRVVGTSYEGLSNANGRYSFRTGSGTLEVEFLKTGYTSAHRQITVPSLGIVDVETVHLWPLPVSEGVYALDQYKYRQADHPRVNRYRVQNAGINYGTPVNPMLTLDYQDPTRAPDKNPPRFFAHKLPAYDARLHKLRKVKAAIAQVESGIRGSKSPKDIQYKEDVWVPGEAIPLMSRPVDEPEHLLLELRPSRPLTPGTYAIHWGALDGYDGIEPRAFLFSMIEPPTGEGEGEGDEGGEGEKAEE